MVMPYVGGVAIISVAKETYPRLPVIAITGWGEHPENLASEAQADIVLKKPIELIELEKKVVSLLLEE